MIQQNTRLFEKLQAQFGFAHQSDVIKNLGSIGLPVSRSTYAGWQKAGKISNRRIFCQSPSEQENDARIPRGGGRYALSGIMSELTAGRDGAQCRKRLERVLTEFDLFVIEDGLMRLVPGLTVKEMYLREERTASPSERLKKVEVSMTRGYDCELFPEETRAMDEHGIPQLATAEKIVDEERNTYRDEEHSCPQLSPWYLLEWKNNRPQLEVKAMFVDVLPNDGELCIVMWPTTVLWGQHLQWQQCLPCRAMLCRSSTSRRLRPVKPPSDPLHTTFSPSKGEKYV